MKPFFLIVSFSLLSAGTLFSQTVESDSLYQLGMELIDNGDYDRAYDVLEMGRIKYPMQSDFRYEQALARYRQERYDEALKLVQEIVERPDATDRYHQLLGNTYDMIGKPEKAIKAYKAGLEKFSESGYLYLELGVMAANSGEAETALGYWELGLTVQPDYSSNFFHAARIFMTTPDRGWGMLYGEIFMNMEYSTNRSAQMRKMLWKSYKDAISMNREKLELDASDKEGGAIEKTRIGGMDFFNTVGMYVDEETEQMYMPFPIFFEWAASKASIPMMLAGGELTVGKLHAFRSDFIEHWFLDTVNAEYLNIALFDYLRQLKEAGLLEAYNHQLFYCEETAEEVQKWAEKNSERFEELDEWRSAHPYPVDVENAFSRRRIKGVPLGSGDESE